MTDLFDDAIEITKECVENQVKNLDADTLQEAWKKRLEMRAEAKRLMPLGDQFCKEGNDLWYEGTGKKVLDKFYVDGLRLRAHGDLRYAEGQKCWAEAAFLKAEADQLWFDAIWKAKGNILVEWVPVPNSGEQGCKLQTGEMFEP